MSSWIKKNIISVTRADSLWTALTIQDANGDDYVPDPNDVIRFALKTSTSDEEEPLVSKIIPNDTLELRLNPEDTDFEAGTYWYDIEITLTNGYVNTIVGPAKFKITPEVGNWR